MSTAPYFEVVCLAGLFSPIAVIAYNILKVRCSGPLLVRLEVVKKLLMMLVPGAVAGIFTSDAALIDYTTWAMRIYMAGIFSTGVQIACQQSFMALGQAKVSLLLACLRKLILLIPLIFILPHVVANPVFGVFLAEPVSDIIAAAVTATTFFLQFNKILDKGAGRV